VFGQARVGFALLPVGGQGGGRRDDLRRDGRARHARRRGPRARARPARHCPATVWAWTTSGWRTATRDATFAWPTFTGGWSKAVGL